MIKRITVLSLLLGLVVSCMPMQSLKTIEVERGVEVPGYFTVTFYGRHYEEEVNAIVILDLEGDGYRFEPPVRAKDFEILTGLTAYAAVQESEPFFRLHSAYNGKKKLYSIIGPKGRVIGYELRPLYDKSFYGAEDMVKSGYFIDKDKNVRVKVKVKSSLEIKISK